MRCIIVFLIGLPMYFADIIKQGLFVSQASYCDTIHNWNCKTCENNSELLEIYDNHGEKALLGRYTDTNTLFVAFRGSENIENWIDNAQFSMTCLNDTSSICVETGFYKVYEYMKKDIKNGIDMYTKKYDTDLVLFTGHSLGGAVATLMAYHYKNTDLQVTLVTFGSPRVGNKEFVMDFKDITSFRITHYYDIVPHIPQMFLEYYHISHEIWYNKLNDNYKECDDNYPYPNEDDTCSNSCGPLHCTSTSDHLHYLNISMGNNGDC